MSGNKVSRVRRMICRIKVQELDRFEEGHADLPPIIQGFEILLKSPWSLTGDRKVKVGTHLSELKDVYAAVAAEFEPWMYHQIQLRLREEPTISRVRKSIAALKELLQS